MGDGVTSEKDLVIKIGDKAAGTTKGQLILEDIEFSGDRDNTEYAGIGHDTTQGVAYGNKTYELSDTGILNDAQEELVNDIVGDDDLSTVDDDTAIQGVIRGSKYEWNIGAMDWASFNFSSSDDGDTTYELDFTARDVSYVEIGADN